mmetsp:Transcript_62944/g.194861  ORF Transcript_62944/g.194861 Transcript_62944/m.194861 type:complete len:283 (-) Transcript_62944:29-877(-)
MADLEASGGERPARSAGAEVRLTEACASEQPCEALYALARALRDEAWGQQALYDLFASHLARHADDAAADERVCDALRDAMDFIFGWHSRDHPMQLFPHSLSPQAQSRACERDRAPVHVSTHRGLEPGSGDAAWGESTVEAFEAQLRRGFGLEFDPNPCADGWAVWRDGTMQRLTGGADGRSIVEVPLAEVAGRRFGRGRVGTLDEVLRLIAEHGSESLPSAMHLKGERQGAAVLDSLVAVLRRHPEAIPKLFVFDVTQSTAAKLKEAVPALSLAPSVRRCE